MVEYFVRNAAAGISIQKVYAPILELAKSKLSANVHFMPCANATPFSLLRNLIFSRSKLRAGHVNHITGDVHYLLVSLPAFNTIVTVHDIGFYTNHRGSLRSWFKWLLWIRILKRARFVVCISEYTRQQLLTCVSIESNKLKVINNPVAPEYIFDAREFNVKCPRVLHIGTGDNKNLMRTVAALKGMRCHLRIVGKIDDKIRFFLEENSIEYSSVHGISDEEMLEEYRNCDIVNFPSTFEGFGMPIVEGQAVGRVVVTSALEPMQSIAAGGAYLVDPYDVQSIRHGYEVILQDSLVRSGLITAGRKNVARFSVDAVFHNYNLLYKEICDGH